MNPKSLPPRYLVPALTLLLGLQSMRVMVSHLQYLLGDRLGLNTLEIGLVALLSFSFGFLSGPFATLLNLRRAVIVSAGGVSLLRFGLHLWTGDPLGDFALALGGTVGLIWFLPLYLSFVRREADKDPSQPPQFAQALLLGLALDVTLNGLFFTYDFAWQSGWLPLVLALALLTLHWRSLHALHLDIPTDRREGEWQLSLPWLAIGPILGLHLLIFGNVGRATALLGGGFPLAFGWLLLGYVIALALITLWTPPRRALWEIGPLFVISLIPFGLTGIGAGMQLLLGQVTLGLLMLNMLNRVALGTDERGLVRLTVSHGVSMLLLMAGLFASYAPFALSLPFANQHIPPVLGLIVVGASVWAAPINRASDRRPAWFAIGLLIAPFAIWIVQSPLETLPPAENRPIRVITYNLHAGFTTSGHLNLRAQVQAIRQQNPDIIALQEVSRGWVINGSVDMVTWLAQELDMPYVFAPSADDLWGVAVFSRYPILTSKNIPLPPRGLPLERNFQHLEIDIGRPSPLHLINTHYHAPAIESYVRAEHSDVLAAYLTAEGLTTQTILLGDLNAPSLASELRPLFEAGLQDAVAIGLENPVTFPADDPRIQLDHIFTTPDFNITRLIIPATTASDHLPVALTVLE